MEATEDEAPAEDEVEDEDEEVPEVEDAAEADTEAVLVTEDHETVTTSRYSTMIIPTITTTMVVNRPKATEPDQKPDEAVSDHEVVSVVEAEEAEALEAVEVVEAAEVEAGTPTKASLVITRTLKLRPKPKTNSLYYLQSPVACVKRAIRAASDHS